MESEF
jgi:hypothetical protein